MSRLLETYNTTVVPALNERFSYGNPMQVPVIMKVVVSMGVGKAVDNKSHVESAAKDLTRIVGQKVKITKARKSIANFRLREDLPIGCMATLRGDRMYEFMDRLISVVLPRIRDFRGLKDNFDGQGNFSLGLTEQSLFPEISLDQVEFQQGMNITVVTTARTDEEGRALLEGFGFPFRKRGNE
ncbi:MAG: 50S ribosomal protein L5 [Planctomycetota bacterium]|nr:50S ribosomal protein L5 [Planctomycetota bacterium]